MLLFGIDQGGTVNEKLKLFLLEKFEKERNLYGLRELASEGITNVKKLTKRIITLKIKQRLRMKKLFSNDVVGDVEGFQEIQPSCEGIVGPNRMKYWNEIFSDILLQKNFVNHFETCLMEHYQIANNAVLS